MSCQSPGFKVPLPAKFLFLPFLQELSLDKIQDLISTRTIPLCRIHPKLFKKRNSIEIWREVVLKPRPGRPLRRGISNFPTSDRKRDRPRPEDNFSGSINFMLSDAVPGQPRYLFLTHMPIQAATACKPVAKMLIHLCKYPQESYDEKNAWDPPYPRTIMGFASHQESSTWTSYY